MIEGFLNEHFNPYESEFPTKEDDDLPIRQIIIKPHRIFNEREACDKRQLNDYLPKKQKPTAETVGCFWMVELNGIEPSTS